uniref:Tetraspanin n=1 Tax=Clastoptera arizonana TaxID=38151 RepID=A0A1B6E2W9_9HEMI
MKTWSSRMMKYLLFVFNLVFVITGIALIAIGMGTKSGNEPYQNLLDDRYFSTPSLLISVGCFIFFIAFLGCCGAIREHYCMVITFSILLSAVLITEVSAGITGYVLSDETADVMRYKVNASMYQYNKTIADTTLWDETQTDLKCCGTNSYKDWYPVFNNTLLPVSCCGPQPGAIGQLNCNADTKTLYKQPCLQAMADFISQNISKIGFGAFTIAFVQLIGVLFACRLAKNIKESYETV